MTTAELMKNIGKVAKWHDDKGMTFYVTITDSRVRWGQVDYLVVPVEGHGSRWVADSSLTSIGEVEA